MQTLRKGTSRRSTPTPVAMAMNGVVGEACSAIEQSAVRREWQYRLLGFQRMLCQNSRSQGVDALHLR